MDINKHKSTRRNRRKVQIRRRVSGTPDRPRLVVYKSLKHIYAQVIDDLAGHTLVAASTLDADAGAGAGTGNQAGAKAVGSLIAQRAKAAGVSQVQFDRSGFRYHGRVKALADAAREGGLKF